MLDIFYSRKYFAIGLLPVWRRTLFRSNRLSNGFYTAIGPLYIRIGRF